MSGALARLLFYPTLAYNVVMEKVSSRRWFDRVDQTVILGALPFKSMTEELVQRENVRGVITMNEEYETKYFCNSAEEWKAAGVEQLRLSTVDLTGVPHMEDLHRGATVVAAYLIKLHCWSPEEACQTLRSIRPHVLVRKAQMELLRSYYQQVCNSQPT
ncbi:hypothetical protein ANANG_G00210630 [Anguilla anguilla]|uniref:Tyrosine specific protein phosphatases domain-containing protein n=1 Tax=Anguilla anguilla TaxID=7936 RepID=A0A9D3RRB2_ANGAN|nr:hypothetical protein ANANG_G00210630 [Anguilla anguilla]